MIALALTAALAAQNPAPGEAVRWTNPPLPFAISDGPPSSSIQPAKPPRLRLKIQAESDEGFAAIAEIGVDHVLSVRACAPGAALKRMGTMTPARLAADVMILAHGAEAYRLRFDRQVKPADRRAVRALLARVRADDWPALKNWRLCRTPKPPKGGER